MRDVIGSLLFGVAVAIAHPVLDLLSRNLPFFTAHHASPLDIVGLALLLTVVLPLLVALPIAAWSDSSLGSEYLPPQSFWRLSPRP